MTIVGKHDWSHAQTLSLKTSGGGPWTPLIYGRCGTAYVVAAVGATSDGPPVWLRELERDPRSEIKVLGMRLEVRARAASPEEEPPLWRMMTRYFHEDRGGLVSSHSVSAVVLLEPSDALLVI